MNHAGEQYPVGLPVEMLTGMGGNGRGGTTRPSKSLAIVGSHPATREKAPYDDPNFEIWLFNEAPQKPEVYRRWDASFQMHLPEVYQSTENWVNKDHWEWLQQDHGDKTIWMMETDPLVPNSKRYPIEDVLGLVPYRYLRSTPAEALALGIYLGYKRIDLYGSELSSNTEYRYQAINYAFWIGFAHGHGVDLRMNCWQQEFFQPIYGYEGETQIPMEYFEERYKSHEVTWKAKDSVYRKMQDQLVQAMLDHKYDRVGELSLALETVAINTGEYKSRMDEARRYADRTNPISRQEFERVSAKAQKDGKQVEADMHHNAGICEYIWNVWRQTGKHEALKQLRDFLKKRTDLAYEMGEKLGVFNENMKYINKYDELVTAAGGERAVHQVQVA